MINYIEFLNVPTKTAIALVGLFLVMQVIGEILEFKGKVVPEFVKVRKVFARKKQEKELAKEMHKTLEEVKQLFSELNAHYYTDNIRMRDAWIKGVNQKLEKNDSMIKEIDKKLDQSNQAMLSLLIDSKRNTIINFASFVIDEKNSVTREQFNRIFKLYEEYEEIITANGMTNGEVDIALCIIKESYESHMRNHSFVEDAHGYPTPK